ncbi:hypothetical protein Caci_3626 [Catenulispora acidiphila DSM 44928]|uniref:Uncharacterized protein n=2 Tax=Catenulispora TaxID=414878 RepID=C7QAN0_CATAD|nr:hypothetical protein Caci_3626 [Catenulispora acidiphila DSM 44928]
MFDAVVYFVVTAGTLAVVLWHVDARTAVPWASPWRMRLPKLCAVGGPALFFLVSPIVLTGGPEWVGVASLIGALLAPWAGAVLIIVERLRRRAEDRATGIARPVRPWI